MTKKLAKSLVAVLFLGVFLGLSSPAAAQSTAEVNFGLGYSIVNLDEWSGGSLSDWNQMMYQGNAQVYFARLGNLQIGAEAGYTYFFWYDRYDYGLHEPNALHFSAVARLKLGGNLFFDFGAGAYLFSGWTDFGALGELGYMIKVSPKLSVPIKVRTTVILDNPILIPVSVSAGILYHF
jgi:hypothetical protein